MPHALTTGVLADLGPRRLDGACDIGGFQIYKTSRFTAVQVLIGRRNIPLLWSYMKGFYEQSSCDRRVVIRWRTCDSADRGCRSSGLGDEKELCPEQSWRTISSI